MTAEIGRWLRSAQRGPMLRGRSQLSRALLWVCEAEGKGGSGAAVSGARSGACRLSVVGRALLAVDRAASFAP